MATGSGRGGVPQRGGWWPGRGIRVRARAAETQAGREPGFETWPASPHLDAGSVRGADPGARPPGLPASPPPGLPLCTHLRGSSRGSRPAPARLPIPGPGGDGRAGEKRAPRPGGRSGPRGCAGGRRRAAGTRTAEARARRPRRVLCPLARPRCRRSAPTRRSPAPAQSDWPSAGPVPPPAKSHWTSRKRRFVRPPGGRGF